MTDDKPDTADFAIEGPDADGFVWICSSQGRSDWCHNLGPVEAVAEALSQWLAATRERLWTNHSPE